MDPEWAMIWPKTCRRFVSSKRQPMPWRIYVEDLRGGYGAQVGHRPCLRTLATKALPNTTVLTGSWREMEPGTWTMRLQKMSSTVDRIYIYISYILYILYIYIIYDIYIYILYIYIIYINYILYIYYIIIVVIIIIYYYSLYTYSHTFWTHVTWNANKQINMQI